MARARKAAETAEAEATAAGKEKREELVAAAKRDIEAETRRSLEQIRKEVADLTVLATEKVTRKSAHRRRPAPPGRGGAQRGRLHQPLGGGERASRCPRSPAYTPRRSSTSPRRRASSTRSASSSASSPTPLDGDRDLQVFFFSPYFSSAEKVEGLSRALSGADPELVNFLELLIEKHRMTEIFRIRRQLRAALEAGEQAARRDRDQRGRARPGGGREGRRGDRAADRPEGRAGQPRRRARSSAASSCRSATWSSTRASAVAWRNFERASRRRRKEEQSSQWRSSRTRSHRFSERGSREWTRRAPTSPRSARCCPWPTGSPASTASTTAWRWRCSSCRTGSPGSRSTSRPTTSAPCSSASGTRSSRATRSSAPATCCGSRSATSCSAAWSTRSAARSTTRARSRPPRPARPSSKRPASSSASRSPSRCRPA